MNLSKILQTAFAKVGINICKTQLVILLLVGWSRTVSVNFLLMNITQISITEYSTRAICRIKLLPVTHVLVDTWMLTLSQFTNFKCV